MSTYTPAQYVVELNRRISEINFSNSAIYEAVADAHANYCNRIFESGKRATGASIGSYSRSYAKYRQKKKRQTAFVDLKLTTRLSTDIVNSLTRVSKYSIINGVKNTKKREEGVVPIPKTSKKKKGDKNTEEVTNSKKLQFIIDRYGRNVFLMSQKERQVLDKDIAEAVIKIFKS